MSKEKKYCEIKCGRLAGEWQTNRIKAAKETELENYSINVGEAFLTEISENLHEHYAHQNMSNYAWRLQKLMKIVNSVREIEREREEMMRLCELFDVFKIRLSDKDLFIC
uniref:NR LBD domain-containing protein n=1 Tax=Caenorhabditis japonica TaxID=281687 RepID=A0A8R1E8G0_CAEJA